MQCGQPVRPVACRRPPSASPRGPLQQERADHPRKDSQERRCSDFSSRPIGFPLIVSPAVRHFLPSRPASLSPSSPIKRRQQELHSELGSVAFRADAALEKSLLTAHSLQEEVCREEDVLSRTREEIEEALSERRQLDIHLEASTSCAHKLQARLPYPHDIEDPVGENTGGNPENSCVLAGRPKSEGDDWPESDEMRELDRQEELLRSQRDKLKLQADASEGRRSALLRQIEELSPSTLRACKAAMTDTIPAEQLPLSCGEKLAAVINGRIVELVRDNAAVLSPVCLPRLEELAALTEACRASGTEVAQMQAEVRGAEELRPMYEEEAAAAHLQEGRLREEMCDLNLEHAEGVEVLRDQRTDRSHTSCAVARLEAALLHVQRKASTSESGTRARLADFERRQECLRTELEEQRLSREESDEHRARRDAVTSELEARIHRVSEELETSEAAGQILEEALAQSKRELEAEAQGVRSEQLQVQAARAAVKSDEQQAVRLCMQLVQDRERDLEAYCIAAEHMARHCQVASQASSALGLCLDALQIPKRPQELSPTADDGRSSQALKLGLAQRRVPDEDGDLAVLPEQADAACDVLGERIAAVHAKVREAEAEFDCLAKARPFEGESRHCWRRRPPDGAFRKHSAPLRAAVKETPHSPKIRQGGRAVKL